MYNHEATVRLLLAHPAVDAERAVQSAGVTPLLIACMNRSTAAALALLEAKADPNARDNNGDSPLAAAHRADNAQLEAALVVKGADVTAIHPPLLAKCMLGDARAAAALLAADPAAADGDSGLPAAVAACLRGDAAALAAPLPLRFEARDDGLPPAFFFAVELGDKAVVAAVLEGAEGLTPEGRELMCKHAETAATALDAAAPEYVPGARYFAVLLALVGEGLVDVKKSDPVKELAAAYLGSLGAAAFFDRAPRAFGQLKAAMEKRLDVIAEPLERTYEEEKLGERLSSLGEGKQGAAVRLDDDLLLPMPKFIMGRPPTDKAYEPYMLRYIVMASLACDGAPRPPPPSPPAPAPPPSPSRVRRPVRAQAAQGH